MNSERNRQRVFSSVMGRRDHRDRDPGKDKLCGQGRQWFLCHHRRRFPPSSRNGYWKKPPESFRVCGPLGVDFARGWRRVRVGVLALPNVCGGCHWCDIFIVSLLPYPRLHLAQRKCCGDNDSRYQHKTSLCGWAERIKMTTHVFYMGGTEEKGAQLGLIALY
jgi:hypothetical protein